MVVEEVTDTEPENKTTAPKASDEKPVKAETDTKVEIKTETQPEKKEVKFNPLWILIPGVIVLGLLVGGIFAYEKGLANLRQQAAVTPSPLASLSPTVSPSASPAAINLTQYTLSILNGSGIAGEAGKAKTLLEKVGFKVGTVGNASAYDYSKTIIQAKETVTAGFLSQLKTTLAKTYQMAENETLKSTASQNVVIIIGSTKAP